MHIPNLDNNRRVTFKVAALSQLNSPLTIKSVESPEILGAGQVFVRIFYSGLCASQLNEISGAKGADPYLPHALGHEGVGEIAEVGPGVSRFSRGDVVVMHWRKSIGCSAKGSAYSEIGGGKINFGPVTTLSQYSVISEDRLTPLPKDFPLAVAPLLGCALLTGFGAVTREARVVPGESCLILGLGGIGISILKSLRMVSALPITVVDISTEKLELAKRLGAHEVYLIGREESSAADFLRIAGVEAPDVVFECTGKRHLIEAAISAVKPDGRVLLIGVPDSRDPAHIPTLKLHLGVTLMGSHGGLSLPHVDIPRLGALHSAGLLELTDFPISKFALEDVNSAIEMLKSGILGRAIIEMD